VPIPLIESAEHGVRWINAACPNCGEEGPHQQASESTVDRMLGVLIDVRAMISYQRYPGWISLQSALRRIVGE
jgi:hypothetical protein